MSGFPTKIVGVFIAMFLLIKLIESGPTNLDCRRFVFAPACRGATIKRSSIPTGYGDLPPKFRILDENLEVGLEPVDDESDQPNVEDLPIWNLKVQGQIGDEMSKMSPGYRRLGRRWEN